MYVPGLKKNLAYVSMLKYRGYDVIFGEGKVFLRHKAMGQVKNIGVLVKNIYNMDVQDYVTLSTKVEKEEIQDIDELWQRRLGHLHHTALRIMQQIYIGLPKGTLAQRDTCKGCIMGKYTKATFHYKKIRAMKILERVHSDMCGSFSIASKTKRMYYVILLMIFL